MRDHREHIHGLHVLCLVATFLEVDKMASEGYWVTADVNDAFKTCCTGCFDKGKVEPFARWIHHNHIWLYTFQHGTIFSAAPVSKCTFVTPFNFAHIKLFPEINGNRLKCLLWYLDFQKHYRIVYDIL